MLLASTVVVVMLTVVVRVTAYDPTPEPLSADKRVFGVLVAFHPEDKTGPVKMPPVERGKPDRIVVVLVTCVVMVVYVVDWTVAVGFTCSPDGTAEDGTGESVMVVTPIVTLDGAV